MMDIEEPCMPRCYKLAMEYMLYNARVYAKIATVDEMVSHMKAIAWSAGSQSSVGSFVYGELFAYCTLIGTRS